MIALIMLPVIIRLDPILVNASQDLPVMEELVATLMNVQLALMSVQLMPCAKTS